MVRGVALCNLVFHMNPLDDCLAHISQVEQLYVVLTAVHSAQSLQWQCLCPSQCLEAGAVHTHTPFLTHLHQHCMGESFGRYFPKHILNLFRDISILWINSISSDFSTESLQTFNLISPDFSTESLQTFAQNLFSLLNKTYGGIQKTTFFFKYLKPDIFRYSTQCLQIFWKKLRW